MKYIIIPFIAFGLVLSIAFGLEYNCVGPGMFPKYYGSPFVFKQESLGSSMEFFYSISGLILNTVFWSILLIIIRLAVLNLIKKTGGNRIFKTIYKVVIIGLIGFATLNILVDSVMIGRGFEEGRNYWYMDLDKEAKNWGMECDGEWKMFAK